MIHPEIYKDSAEEVVKTEWKHAMGYGGRETKDETFITAVLRFLTGRE